MMEETKNTTHRSAYRKRRKKRAAIRLIKNIIVFSLVFIIGFGGGLLIGLNSSDDKEELTPAIADETKDVISEVAVHMASYTETVLPKESSDEIKILEDLKKEFVRIMSAKYPSVEVSFVIKNLDTGAKVVHNNKQMNSASIIKLFILETVYKEMAKGNYQLTDEKKTALNRMITESNNNAANLFIDDFGGENEKRKITEENTINKTIKENGYLHTEINRKMHDTTPPGGPSGYQNYSSPEDVCVFLEGIYFKALLDEPYNTETLSLLKKQQRRGKIPAKIVNKYPNVVVANKTGELSQVENDAALIMGDDFNLVFVIMTDGIPFKSDGSTDYGLKEDVQGTISELALMLVEKYMDKTN